jgi:E3 ubiquitin-protein ligase BRE1
LLLPKESNNNEPNEEAIRKTPLFTDIMAKLRTSERLTEEHKREAEKIRESWAAAKGDLDLAKKTLTDMEGKHERRWVELISQYSQPEFTSKGEASDLDGKDLFTNAKKTAELEIKLQQSLESVSRMDTVRATLNDALKMNEQLQSKLEDLKSKNAKMVAEKAAARASNKEADPLKAPELLKKQSTGAGDPTIEKLQRDYRRARKEVSAAVLSKDQAKLKQEVRLTVALSIVCNWRDYMSSSHPSSHLVHCYDVL